MIAAAMLAGLKLVVGVFTGSLGMIAEAMHSGLDFVAALLTLFAVRWADRPADVEHPYGHGRVENLSAFFEAGLLILTAGWVVVEALRRLLVASTAVEPSIWAFVVMGLSIVVNVSRARALQRAAREHGSQALEADALHFGTDIWSSAVVIVGLSAVLIGRAIGQEALFDRGDAIAAIVVAAIVLWVAGGLARETIDALLDRAPETLVNQIAEAVANVPNVIEVGRVRVRRAGNAYFADIVVAVPRTKNFAQTHATTEAIERAVHAIQPRTDVVVHAEPGIADVETLAERIEFVARERGVRVHDVQIRRLGDHVVANLHAEVSPHLSLRRAHEIASELERAIVAEAPAIHTVNVHVEAPEQQIADRIDVTATEPGLVRDIRHVAEHIVGKGRCRDIQIFRTREIRPHGYDVVLRCELPAGLSVASAHVEAEKIEAALRRRIPALGSVLVHVEPR